jgi:hypothetical protein
MQFPAMHAHLVTVPTQIILCFTGHGGPNAADYVRSNLFINLLEHTKFNTDITSALGGHGYKQRCTGPAELC